MKKMSKYNPEYIDDEEREMMESFESIDVTELKPPTKAEQEEFKSAAKEYIKTNTKMNIRIDPFELEKIKAKADQEGLKYQTFIKSVLHKYITGQLVEKDKRAG
jgi:predicted DNA binding CopG/RHH family protein